MRFILPCFLIVASHLAFPQKEASHWFFGARAGMFFKPEGPIPLAGSNMNTQNGCAVISDKNTGELLFYSNGRNVWNRFHQLMPHGQDFPADCWSSITQSALIVPDPGDTKKFYLFSIYYTENPGDNILIDRNCLWGRSTQIFYRDVRFSLIDMSLENGLGDVVEVGKHILLQTNVTEKLTAVPHTNGQDFWIITHEFGGNGFYAYPLTSAGIGQPTVTHIGSVHELKPELFFQDEETMGYMKASPNGKKIACAVGLERRPFDLFDFDASTGVLSNYINLGLVRGQSGVSFSPDNSKLYASTDDRPEPPVYPYPDIIIQYDLHAGDAQAIVASRKSIIRDNPFTNIPGHGTFDGFLLVEQGLQLGIDGRLYVTSDYAYMPTDAGIVVIIEKPNEPGFLCQVNYKRLNFQGGSVGIGLPNFIQSYFNGIESASTCGEAGSISVYPNPTYGTVTLEIPSGCSPAATLQVVSVTGQEILIKQLNATEASIDLSYLQQGVYFFIVSSLYNKKIVKKIVKL